MDRNCRYDQDGVGENAENPQRDHRPHRGRGNHKDGREEHARRSRVFCQM